LLRLVGRRLFRPTVVERADQRNAGLAGFAVARFVWFNSSRRVQVQRDVQPPLLQPLQKERRIREVSGLPSIAGPAELVPVHVHNKTREAPVT